MKAYVVLAMMVALGASPASATVVSAPAMQAGTAPAHVLLAEAANDYPIKPSDAALIAQKTVPDSKVLNVKLLPSGEYVVTLKAGGNVQKVMVNATTGAAH